jgi:hypothetical protein
MAQKIKDGPPPLSNLEKRLIRVVEVMAYEAFCLALAAQGTQRGRDAYTEIRNPKVGDLVIECSTIHQPERRDIDGLGFLTETGTQSQFVLRRLDGREAVWRNAQCIKVTSELYDILGGLNVSRKEH